MFASNHRLFKRFSSVCGGGVCVCVCGGVCVCGVCVWCVCGGGVCVCVFACQ